MVVGIKAEGNILFKTICTVMGILCTYSGADRSG